MCPKSHSLSQLPVSDVFHVSDFSLHPIHSSSFVLHKWYYTHLTIIKITTYVNMLHQNINSPQEMEKDRKNPQHYLQSQKHTTCTQHGPCFAALVHSLCIRSSQFHCLTVKVCIHVSCIQCVPNAPAVVHSVSSVENQVSKSLSTSCTHHVPSVTAWVCFLCMCSKCPRFSLRPVYCVLHYTSLSLHPVYSVPNVQALVYIMCSVLQISEP